MTVGKSPFGGSNQDETCRNILNLGRNNWLRLVISFGSFSTVRSCKLKFPPGLEPLAEAGHEQTTAARTVPERHHHPLVRAPHWRPCIGQALENA